jgi:hypothetical protein
MGKQASEFTVPQGVEKIGKNAFLNCKALSKIILPEGVSHVEGGFNGCENLSEIVVPDSITGFYGYFGEKMQYNIYDNVKYLGNENNPYLVLVKLADYEVESCIIHEDTKIIQSGAFSIPYGYNQKLTSLIIPKSVEYIQGGIGDDLVLYAEATSQPSGWVDAWCYPPNTAHPLAHPHYFYKESKPNSNVFKRKKYWHYVDGVPTIWE